MTTPALDRPSFQTVDQWREFVNAFDEMNLPAVSWNHRAHLAVGLWYAMHHPSGQALEMLRAGICRYNEAIGIANTDNGGYHETLTRVFLVGIAGFLAQRAAVDPLSVLNELLVSDLADKKWPLRFYSRERICSISARKTWVEPDLRPLSEAGSQ